MGLFGTCAHPLDVVARAQVKLCTCGSSNLQLPAGQAFYGVPNCAGHTAKASRKLPSRLVLASIAKGYVCCVGVHTPSVRRLAWTTGCSCGSGGCVGLQGQVQELCTGQVLRGRAVHGLNTLLLSLLTSRTVKRNRQSSMLQLLTQPNCFTQDGEQMPVARGRMPLQPDTVSNSSTVHQFARCEHYPRQCSCLPPQPSASWRSNPTAGAAGAKPTIQTAANLTHSLACSLTKQLQKNCASLGRQTQQTPAAAAAAAAALHHQQPGLYHKPDGSSQ